jgi:NodT family efflux transporter outer membrane factor (OMF) lipoprotein
MSGRSGHAVAPPRLHAERRAAPCLFRAAILAGVVALASGCVVGPDYVKPKIAVPTAYKELDGWKVAQPSDAVIRGAWWEVFGDPELNALEEQVNISNQNIRVAEAQFQEARTLVRQARAAYFPIVSVGLGVTRSRGTALSTGLPPGISSSGGGNAVTDYSLPINASWELDLWGRIRRSVESNQASAQASGADLQSVRLSMQASLAQAYFQLRTFDAQRDLLEATVVNFEKSLEITRNEYASGTVSQLDVLQAETQLKTTQAQLIDVGVQRAQTEHAIALLVGKAASIFSLAPAPLAGTPPSIPPGLPSELLERRPDIAAAERLAASANAQIGFAEAAYYPTLTLSASGGFNSSSLAKWLAWPSRFWSVGPTLSETVFDGGLRRAQTDFARAAYDASVATYRQTVLTGFQQVEDNLAALRILEEEAAAQDAAVTAAQKTVTVTINQYQAGTVSYLNVVTAQTAALTNEINALFVQGRRMAAAVSLIQALGGGWSTADLPSTKAVTERP